MPDGLSIEPLAISATISPREIDAMNGSDVYENPNAYTDDLPALAAAYCDLMVGAGARLFVYPDGRGRWEDYQRARLSPVTERRMALLQALCSDAGDKAIADECRRRGWVGLLPEMEARLGA